MEVVAIAVGLALLWAYVALAVFCARKIWRISSRPEWMRIQLCALVWAGFFAPAFVGAGHGGGMAPAWFALMDPDSSRQVIEGALISLASTWAIFAIIGELARRIRKHQQK